ncbi:non-ribosomal peptide synthetase [Streptomyces sp. B21-083]|uniref:non-ribosomal peptide synthetase n=1 Tax=Streptomyces sp. B21-083 TaxID=3039410 RepID=UPI002FEE8A63
MTDTHPSAEDLSPAERERLLAALRQRPRAGGRDGIPARRPGAPVLASLTQQRIWLLDQIRPGLPTYNETAGWRLTGDLDTAVLRDCLSEIVRRHEALRTTFTDSADGPVQLIGEPRPVRLDVTDLTGLPGDRREEQARAAIVERARQPFDLARGPLLRVSLLKLATREHVLVLIAHHIVTDGWSTDLFRFELTELYAAFSRGEPSPLAEPATQYADFADWQRRRSGGPDLDAQLDHWRRELAGIPALLELPIAAPRPEVATHDGARFPFTVPADLGRAVADLAGQHGATPFMVLLGALQTLLHRYTGERDIVVGTALAGREHPELEKVIGFFANTVVLRGSLDADATFADVLGQAREAVIAAHDNQDVPFDSVVDAIGPQRSPGHNPLFQTMLVLENAPAPRDGGGERTGLRITPDEVDIGVAKYDLVLQLRTDGDAFGGVWEYSTDLYAADAIEALGTHFLTLLADAVSHPDRPLAELALLPEPELRSLVRTGNATEALPETGGTIHRLFEEQAARTPDAVAVAEESGEVSYSELNARANRLARWLRRSGIQPGALVGIALRPSADLLVALLAVLKAGAAYLPMDPAYGSRRLEAMAADAAPVAVLTDSEVAADLPDLTAQRFLLDRVGPDQAAQDDHDLESTGSPDDLAYVMFTSGSTGRPNGVMVSHANLVASTTARWSRYDSPPERYLLLSSLSFDSSVAGIYWTLTTGGTLLVPPTVGDIPVLCRSLAESRPTHLLCVPSLYELILQETKPADTESLTCVILAGEPLYQDLVSRHREQLPATALFNEYGPTEATVWSTVQRCGPSDLPGQVPVGRPIPGTRIRLLDRAAQPVPAGVPGELCIGGAGVSQGYLGRPELTAERFVEDPFADGVLYRSGDLGRYLPDGTIQLLGRIDNQLKVRGYRIEPGEIEAALREHPEVEAALAGAEQGTDSHRRLVAQVVPRGDGVSAARLHEFLRTRVPHFAVPSLIELVDELPRLPNGKLDRAALTVSKTYDAALTGNDPALTGLAAELADVWKATLGLDSVRADDNFFEMGGDSLTVVKVYNQFKQRSGKSFAITDMIKYPTIGRFVAFLDAR